MRIPNDESVRACTLRMATLNEEERSIEAVLATEDQVANYDMGLRQVVDEVLIMRGGDLPEKVILVDSHPEIEGRIRSEDIRGSVRNLRIEDGQLVGRLHFARDPASDALWGKYRDGHADSVSPAFKPLETTKIRPGQSRVVNGKTYRAGNRSLYITTRWAMPEVSTVPYGADRRAKVRQQFPSDSEGVMNERLQQYLRSIGLRSEATPEQTQQFQALLAGRQAQISNLLESEPQSETARFAARAALKELGVDPEDPTKALVTRSETNEGDESDGPHEGQNLGAELREFDPEPLRAEGAKLERERVVAIRGLGAGIDEKLVVRAIEENWDTTRASAEFLRAHQEGRTESVGAAPAIHSRSREADCTREALGAAMTLRAGLDPVENHVRYVDGALVPVRGDAAKAALEQAADQGYRYRDWSLIDVCREALRLDGVNIPTTRGEMIRAAVSGSTLTSIFTTSVSAQLVAGYQDSADSTAGWTSSADVPNFQTNERIAMSKFGALKKLARGKTAEHLDESDSKEEYKIARYAGQFVVDEQDIIDDRLGAVDQVSPSDMGSSAAQLRPNLVYAILLANAALADTGALFNATAETTTGGHANLTTDALDAPGLEAGLVAMAKHRIRTRPINIKARYLIVPHDIVFTASVLLKSALRDFDGTDGNYNPLANEGLDLIRDDRIGLAGVTDPATETVYPGTITNWFLSGRPGENGAKTIEVGYLRGTGRAPQLRAFVLTQGQWGVGWDINLDIGAKALDWRALLKSTGAA